MRVLLALLLAFVSATVSAQQRQLYWDTVAVKAHLDAEGRLQIEERQEMVFTGDWNGGERQFNIRPRNDFSFEGMSRIDANGTEVPMEDGSLDAVDHYSFTDRNVLRWRARTPSDPPFEKTPLTYVLRYSLGNILLRDGEEYVLDHDFAFSEREGSILHFRLDLDLDPVWQTRGALQKTWTVEEIPPGESFVLRVPLRYGGTGAPAAIDGPGPELRGLLAGLTLVPLLLLGYALFRERLLGRLDRVTPEQVNRTWIEQNLLRQRPEVIGAMWDSTVGADEVSATLARMVAEGRLKSTIVNGDELELEILSRGNLDGYEQALLDGLFFRGNTTSTAAIRKHYEDSGFDPAKTMSDPLMQYAQARLPKGEPVKPAGGMSWLLFFGAIAAFAYAVLRHREFLAPSIAILVGGMIASLLSMIAPSFWRPRKHLGVPTALLAMLPAAVVVAAAGFVIWRSATIGSPELPLEMQGAIAVLAVWLFSVAVRALRSTESREAIAFLKMVGAARDYFRRELRKPHPALDDAWYPYALAFGLDSAVQKWFRSFPGSSASTDDDRFTSSSSASSSSSFSGSSWSGGGGAFGGAGASGMWALAASGMAAGVAAPSSSSDSGSSSSSSGGSSGGGGGGGW